MKVKDFLEKLKGSNQIKLVYADRVISSFDGQFWNTITPEALDLEIREIKINGGIGGCIMIGVASGIPFMVSTAQELQMAMDDSEIQFIALANDIYGDDGSEYTVMLSKSGAVKSLNLNGHTLYGPGATGDVGPSAIIVSDGCLDIFDSSDEGGDVIGSFCKYLIWANNKGYISIRNGSFSGGDESDESAAIYVSAGGNIDIYDGYFKNPYYSDSEEVKHLVLLKDEEATGDIVCCGGYYTQQDPQNFLEAGCISYALEGTDPVIYYVKKVV